MKNFQALTILIVSLFILQTSCNFDNSEEEKNSNNQSIKDTIPVNMSFGFDFNKFDVHEGIVEKDWTLSHLLLPFNVSQGDINIAYNFAKDSAHLNYISKGNTFFMLCKKDEDTIHQLEYAIYQKNAEEYFVFDFTDSTIQVLAKKKPVKITLKQISARIKKGGNLSFALDRAVKSRKVSIPLIDKISGIYSWSIDFFHLHIDDKLKIQYEEKSVEGEVIGVGEIHAALFNHNDHDFYAFKYQIDSAQSYYNEEGKGMKSLFLAAPLKYSRMSSGYNKRRYLKMYGRIKPHLGTDYAAPRGTPIWTTANGVISRRGYNRGNGNFVKVKHNKTYSTQYLHMSRIADGIKVGKYVQQGEVIGYVGSTGSSTGNHVCYRFWKNGKQVDSRKQKFENAKPMDSIHLKDYLLFMDSVKPVLDAIEFPVLDTIKAKEDSLNGEL